MNKEELLKKAIKLGFNEEPPPFKGIFIVQKRKLHDSGYRLMNIIGHTDYDKRLGDCKYYLISTSSDVINFRPEFDKYIKGNFSMTDLNLDISKNGIIHIWTNNSRRLKCCYTHVSSCILEVVE